MTTAAPLAGIRILEVGTMLAGPYATMLLADLGAEVTKIEPAGGEIVVAEGDAVAIACGLDGGRGRGLPRRSRNG